MSLTPEECEAMHTALVALDYRSLEGEPTGAEYEAIWLAAKAWAYERAAKECFDVAVNKHRHDWAHAKYFSACADAVRALKGPL